MKLALLEMREGSQAHVICSPDYAYGQLGIPPRIPRNSTIVFDLRVVAIENTFCLFFNRPTLQIYEREMIPIDYILDQAERISDKAKSAASVNKVIFKLFLVNSNLAFLKT